MKSLNFFILLFIIASCSNNQKGEAQTKYVAPEADTSNFFGVTDYLKGQIFEIKQKGLTPKKYITIGNKTDSAWVPIDSLQQELYEFLNPVIDTTSLKHLFKEDKFLDQTLATFTFTYQPKTVLPQGFELQHWDLYIDQETQTVKRIYLVKNKPNNILLQLTWLSGKWCKTVFINQAKVIREEKIMWEY